jgi:hypothetical protein
VEIAKQRPDFLGIGDVAALVFDVLPEGEGEAVAMVWSGRQSARRSWRTATPAPVPLRSPGAPSSKPSSSSAFGEKSFRHHVRSVLGDLPRLINLGNATDAVRNPSRRRWGALITRTARRSIGAEALLRGQMS